jgi:hypothetical protein
MDPTIVLFGLGVGLLVGVHIVCAAALRLRTPEPKPA